IYLFPPPRSGGRKGVGGQLQQHAQCAAAGLLSSIVLPEGSRTYKDKSSSRRSSSTIATACAARYARKTFSLAPEIARHVWSRIRPPATVGRAPTCRCVRGTLVCQPCVRGSTTAVTILEAAHEASTLAYTRVS